MNNGQQLQGCGGISQADEERVAGQRRVEDFAVVVAATHHALLDNVEALREKEKTMVQPPN